MAYKELSILCHKFVPSAGTQVKGNKAHHSNTFQPYDFFLATGTFQSDAVDISQPSLSTIKPAM